MAHKDALISLAEEVSHKAYCPYSRFPVGCAIESHERNIFVGCNVENAVYGLTICAERNAVFKMVASGDKTIRSVVIYTPASKLTPPCGACRQVLYEFGNADTEIIITNGQEEAYYLLGYLLPFAFTKNNL